ncbi:unnamed protein product [Dicrocoelium dendriticum]|nr:unnamed protein product [Dicrocoelium dendriticum]
MQLKQFLREVPPSVVLQQAWIIFTHSLRNTSINVNLLSPLLLCRADLLAFLLGSTSQSDSIPNSAASPLNSSSNCVLLSWYPNGLATTNSSFNALPIPNCDSSHLIRSGPDSFKHHHFMLPEKHSTSSDCRFQSFQATKLSWAELETSLPLIHQLVNRMRLSQIEYQELLTAALSVSPLLTEIELKLHYYNVACDWVRRHRTLWKQWTEGWNVKQNLTIAGLFTLYGKWFIPNLHDVAVQAVELVNSSPDYFANTEYALTLDVRNLTCVQEIVVDDYFGLQLIASDKKLIGVIAALCSDSIEPVVEVANHRQQLVISPTVESSKILEKQIYPYFFRTVPSMLNANMALIRIFLLWSWHRVALFRKDDHFFDPRLFQANGIEVIIDVEVSESELTYDVVQRNLKEMLEHNSRIFIIEHFAQGTAMILCAAYHLNLHFDAGYVWFINPWLADGWWRAADVLPDQCTLNEMNNITAWTFTVTHQLVVAPMLHSSLQQQQQQQQQYRSPAVASVNRHFLRRTPRNTDLNRLTPDDITKRSIPVMNTVSYSGNDYAIYTYESVLVLATALIRLLRSNPSAISIFDSPDVTEIYRDFVANISFGYHDFWDGYSVNTTSSFEGLTSFVSPGEFYNTDREDDNIVSYLRFNDLNERIADYWLLKQHQVNRTIPIVMMYAKGNLSSDALSRLDSAAIPSVEQFSRFVTDRWLVPAYWGKNDGIPGDGSESGEDCTFHFISHMFGVNCSTSVTIFSIALVVLIALPLFLLFLVYYRRKLREAERRIRQPYEELCAELADIDIPSADVVLNRRVGQGAFGMVFGGEAKRKGTWEAVAVKVISGKATYEGKRDFLSEAKLMRELDHKNVVRLVGICLRPRESHLYLIMEVMLLGDLKTYLLSRRVTAQQNPDHEDIRPSTLTQMAIDIAEGLAYLHRKFLVHRDIACRNCLVGSDRTVKIGDFGLTRKFTNPENEGYYRFTRNCELPIRWMSPEAVQFGVFSVHSDIWSYGIVLYEIITFGVFPYDGLGDVEVVERVKQIGFNILNFLPPAALNTTVAGLISQCCQHQWQHRPVSMVPVIKRLRENPDCVRPFLTAEPPKPNRAIDALPFQPGAGACMMSESAVAPEGPNPGANSNPVGALTITDSASTSYGITSVVTGGARGFHSTTGSLVGIGRSSLIHYSTDSFADAAAVALRALNAENSAYPLCRRRHRTADGAVGIGKSGFLRRATSSSSGGGGCSSRNGHGSQVSVMDNVCPTVSLNPEFLQGWYGMTDPSPYNKTVRHSPYVHSEGIRREEKLTGRPDVVRKSDKRDHGALELIPMLPRESLEQTEVGPHYLVNGPTSCTGTAQPTSGSLCQTTSAVLRSLSAEHLLSEQNRCKVVYACTKSAPENRPIPIHEIDKQCTDPNLFSDCDASRRFHSGRHSSGHTPSTSTGLPSTRSVVGNASSLLKSILRVLTRTHKSTAPPLITRNVLRTTRSSLSCRALADPLSRFPNDSQHVSTFCPPLMAAQLSVSCAQLPGHSAPVVSGLSAPPVINSATSEHHFFPTCSLTDVASDHPNLETVITPNTSAPHCVIDVCPVESDVSNLSSKAPSLSKPLSQEQPSSTPSPHRQTSRDAASVMSDSPGFYLV